MAIEDKHHQPQTGENPGFQPELPMDKEGFSSNEYMKETDDGISMSQQVPRDTSQDNKFPPSIKFIMGNEICERFSFYGLKTILTLYCKNFMGYSENTSTVIIHAFNFTAYAFPILGAYVADARIGKYMTILVFSIIYCFGGGFLSLSAMPNVTGDSPGNRSPWALILGLLLIALGTGGIKPVVSAFCGDQLGPHQKGLLQRIFQIFYFCVNFGSFFSTILTPLIRKYVNYWVAFGVPAILLIISTIIFVIGSPKYTKRPVTGSILLTAAKIIGKGAKEGIKSKRAGYDDRYYNDHWLDRAKVKYDPKLVDHVRAALKVLLVFVPMPFFWALFDQTSSRWIYSAMRMDRNVAGSWEIEADQIQALNPLLVLIFVPIFEFGIYTPLRKIGRPFPPLLRMTIGMWLTVAAFLVAMFIEIKIDNSAPLSVSIWLQLPQFFLLTWAELLISITGLEFAYSQAPSSMKSFIMSMWLLTVSLGNAFVVAVVEGIHMKKQWMEYLLFASVMAFFTFIFMIIAWRYVPVDPKIFLYEDDLKAIEEDAANQGNEMKDISQSQQHLVDDENDRDK
eukprot:gene7283-8465_t